MKTLQKNEKNVKIACRKSTKDEKTLGIETNSAFFDWKKDHFVVFRHLNSALTLLHSHCVTTNTDNQSVDYLL